MAESITPTQRHLNGSIRPTTATLITVVTATLTFAETVVVTTAVPLA